MSIHSVDGDGECLFNAVAYGILYLSSDSIVKRIQYKSLARKLRKNTVKMLSQKIQNRDIDYILTMSAEYNNNQSDFSPKQLINRAKLYVKRMSKSCVWGGQIELQMLGHIVQTYGYKGVKVYDAVSKRLLMKSPMAKNKNPVIHIVLHGVNNGGTHYDFWNKRQKTKTMKSSMKI